MKTSNKKYEAIITSRVSVSNDTELENLNIELPPIHIELKPIQLELRPLDRTQLPPVVLEALEPLLTSPQSIIEKDIELVSKGSHGNHYRYLLSERVKAGIARKKLMRKSITKTPLPVKKSKV